MTEEFKPDTYPDGSMLEHFLTYRIVRLYSKLNAQAVRILRQNSDLTITQWRVLSLTVNLGGETTLTEIARSSQMDKGQLSRGIRDLLREGLMASRSSDSDQRQQKLWLTPRGREIYAQTQPKMRRRQKHLMNKLNETERSMIYAIFDKLEIAADEEPVG